MINTYPFENFSQKKRLPKILGDMLYTILRCSKILGQAGKQEILQQN